MVHILLQAEPVSTSTKNDWNGCSSSFVYSYHAKRRATRRSITHSDLDFILDYGRTIQRTGITFYFLARKDLLAAGPQASRAAHLEGTVVLVSTDQEIITVYRNRKALREIQRKSKYC